MSTDRWFGARTLVWLLVWVTLSGAVLLVWYDEDARRHAAALGMLGTAVRAVHAVTTAWLVLGSMVHILVRLRRRATQKGLWTGAALWLAVGIALLSGWLMSQTWVQSQIQAAFPLSATLAGVVHIAYASILVVLALGLHVARWGWRSILAPGRPLAASLLLAATALLLPVALPGDASRWAGVTAWTAVPVLGAWTWPFVLAAILASAALALRRRDGHVP